jgi:hypothetical protein
MGFQQVLANSSPWYSISRGCQAILAASLVCCCKLAARIAYTLVILSTMAKSFFGPAPNPFERLGYIAAKLRTTQLTAIKQYHALKQAGVG